ncbi:uncharacterized protein [Apostichopus japonicus]|uniref:uncharacterized protein n=1 Tax=Stichopus japonicus TaxID=307972 RepID=UPI003AB72E37
MEIALAIRVLWMTAMVTSLAAIARCTTTNIIDEAATLIYLESTIEAETWMLPTGKSTLATETSTLPAGETTLPTETSTLPADEATLSTETNTSPTDDHVDEEDRRWLIIALLVLSAIFTVLLVGCLLCNRDDVHADEERAKRKRDITVIYNETFKMVVDDSGEIVKERLDANIQAPLYSTSKTVETGAGPLPETGRIPSMEESMFPIGQFDADADVIEGRQDVEIL